MAQVEPDDNEEHQIADRKVGILKLLMCLLVEIEIAVDPAHFDKEEIQKMQ